MACSTTANRRMQPKFHLASIQAAPLAIAYAHRCCCRYTSSMCPGPVRFTRNGGQESIRRVAWPYNRTYHICLEQAYPNVLVLTLRTKYTNSFSVYHLPWSTGEHSLLCQTYNGLDLAIYSIQKATNCLHAMTSHSIYATVLSITVFQG